MNSHYGGEKPLFSTLRMDDDRLPAKEQIWGVSINDEQVAFTRSFIEENPVYNTTVGGHPIVVAWFSEYETLGVFNRVIDGQTINVSAINVHGETGEGKLERLPQYPHVFWMVWSNWYPDTDVRS